MPAVSQRVKIKDRIVEILTDAAVEIGVNYTENDVVKGRVYKNRIQELGSDKVPCLVVRTSNETARRVYESPPDEYKRTLGVDIGCYIFGTANPDDDAEELAEKVIKVILRNINDQHNTSTKQFHDLRYTASNLFLDDDGSKNIAYVVLNFEVDYQTTISFAEPPDWETLNSLMYPAGGSGANADYVGDIITVPQD